MSDFAAAVKYLDKTFSRKATSAEGGKDFNSTLSRDIKKIHYYLQLPAFYYTYEQVAQQQSPRLLFQYNVILPDSCSLIMYESYVIRSSSVNSGVLAIKWRYGSTVHRYIFAIGMSNISQIYIPVYNNQVFPKNVCFEFWFTGVNPFFRGNTGMIAPLKLKLSLLANPATADETERLLTADAPIEIPELGFVMPANIPQVQPTIIHISN